MRAGLPSLIASGLLLVSQHGQTCVAASFNAPSTTTNLKAPPDRQFSLLTRLRDSAFASWSGRQTRKPAAQKAVLDKLRARYAGEIVLRFNLTTTEEDAALAEAAARLFLDVWASTGDFVDIRLRRSEVSSLLGLLPQTLQAAQTTLIPDVASAIYKNLPTQNPNLLTELATAVASVDDLIFFQDYQPLPVIVRWMRLLEAMFSYVEYVAIGSSSEGRDIPALRLRLAPVTGNDVPRKTIIITGGIHAREWISTTSVNYVAWSFITSVGKERLITKFLHHFDVVFVPVMNPDGMEYSWQVDRLWRKSRQQTSLRYCRGLDLDHAFGYGWDDSQGQADPCSESYGGEQPFQAVEAMQLAAWARNETHNNVEFTGLIDLHSYAQQVLFPFAFSCQAVPPNLENLEELAAGIAKAIRLADGESYSVASACQGVAASSRDSGSNQSTSGIESGGGSAIDWFYHELGARFSYQIKLRDTGNYGFLLPKEHIIPTGEEVFSAMKYFGDYLLGNNGIEKQVDQVENSPSAAPAGRDDATNPTDHELKRRRLRR